MLLWLVGAVASFGAIRIGSESAVTVPTSAHYSTAMNVRPGMGETVTNNPPIFTWFYNTNHMVGGNDYVSYRTHTNAFQFQIASNATFTGTLLVDVSTPFNFYNFLGPLSTNHGRQFWWRVKYVRTNAYFTNGPYTFTLAAASTNWDRSMFADTNYTATNAVHPMFLFRAGEEAAVWEYAQTNDARSFLDLTNAATAATNAGYWKQNVEWSINTYPIPKFASGAQTNASRADGIGAVLFLWKVSGDNRWTNAEMTGWLLTNLFYNANWYLHPSNNYAMQDYGDSESSIPLRLITATYDWLYTYLGSDTGTWNGQLRTNALHAMRLTARFGIYHDLWKATPDPIGTYVYYYDWNYADRTNYCVETSSPSKQDNSHGALTRQSTMFIGLVGGEDDPELRLHRDWQLNLYFARQSGFAGWAAHHIGVYGYVDNHIYARQLQSALMILHVAHPQAQIRRTEFCQRFVDWYTRMIPYNKRMYHGAYGDGMPFGNWSYFFGGKNRGWDLAALTGDGMATQLYDLNRGSSNVVWDASSHWDQIPVRYHFSLPAPVTNATSAVYPEDGFVIASSKSPGEFDSYTNGVGFSFKASPRGDYQNHQIPDALSFDLWAYGTQLTDGGGDNLNTYGYSAESSPGLFVNGYGSSSNAALYAHTQGAPIESSIVNFTNSGTNFVYCAADGTALFTNRYHPLSNLVTKVRRDILFVRSKYWVIYDSFSTTGPAYFGFRWHIPWAFRYDAFGPPMGNETEFSGDRMGSNSLAMTTNGFAYTAGNYADSTYQNPPRVPVHVVWGNDTNQFGVFNAVGLASLGVSTANVIGTSDTNSTLNPFLNRTYATVNPDRAVGMWVTNRTATTNWHLMTVIVPQQPGVAAPTFLRLDDNTIAVTYDGVTETNTFNTNTVTYTYMVDTSQSGSNPSDGGGPGEEGSGVQSAILRGVFSRGAYVK